MYVSEKSTTSKFSTEYEGSRFYHSVCKFLPDYMASHWKYGDHYLGIVVNSALSDCSVWMHQRGLHHFGTDCWQIHINHVLEGAAILFKIPPCASLLMYSTFRMEMHVVNSTILCLYSTYCSCATQHRFSLGVKFGDSGVWLYSYMHCGNFLWPIVFNGKLHLWIIANTQNCVNNSWPVGLDSSKYVSVG
jgi:hypothetical protein